MAVHLVADFPAFPSRPNYRRNGQGRKSATAMKRFGQRAREDAGNSQRGPNERLALSRRPNSRYAAVFCLTDLPHFLHLIGFPSCRALHHRETLAMASLTAEPHVSAFFSIFFLPSVSF